MLQELATAAPKNARPYASIIANAALMTWPADPRAFAWLMIGVGERETNWRNVRGSDGHGCGLMQIDDRAWRKWCATHNAFDPKQNIPMGAYVLATALKRFPGNLRAGVAAYNCGSGNVVKGLLRVPPDPDFYTTGHNYGADVLARLDRLRPPDLDLANLVVHH